MEAVIFIGVQATGKSTFYTQRFFRTHMRLNLDMLKTRHREQILLRACLDAKQSFVVDNTNPTLEDRARYIIAARDHAFRVTGYYFRSDVQSAKQRNASRNLEERVPDKGLFGTYKRLQLPSFEEGFDQLFYVAIAESGGFTAEEWQREL